jgi:Bacterial TniB protein
MPPTPHERDFYEELLVTMEAVLPVGLSSTNLRQPVRVLARQLEVRMLGIDEIHAMLSSTFREQRIFLNCLRFLAMSFPAPLSLHHYFVVAARMQHHFESNLVAVEESGVAALQDPDLAAFELFSGPRGNFMYYWYASLCVVVQGFRNLKLVDPRVDALLASPNVKALRRCWNGVFHFQPDYFSAKLLEPMQAPDFIGWVRELMEAFRAYFAREIKPVES